MAFFKLEWAQHNLKRGKLVDSDGNICALFSDERMMRKFADHWNLSMPKDPEEEYWNQFAKDGFTALFDKEENSVRIYYGCNSVSPKLFLDSWKYQMFKEGFKVRDLVK